MPAPPHRLSLVSYAKDKSRVSAFHRQTLAPIAIEEQSTYDLLRGPGIEFVVHAIPREYASRINIANPPQVRADTPMKPAFRVGNLAAVRLAAARTGGSLDPAESSWHCNGAVILDGCDPEGDIVQFRKHDDRPCATGGAGMRLRPGAHRRGPAAVRYVGRQRMRGTRSGGRNQPFPGSR